MRRRDHYVVAAIVTGFIVVAIFPFRLLPEFVVDDSVAHLLGGVVIGLVGALLTDRADTAVALAALALGILWEVVESIWFQCLDGPPGPCAPELAAWMVTNDTIADVALVVLGAVVVLVVIGRYE